ncbi:MAG: pyridoxal phosphate-dependent aminotransferase [Burkholderiaceae bacterium]
MFSLASRLKAQGRDIVDLTIGEPEFKTPEHIKSAAIAAINADVTKYTGSSGNAELRAAICAKFERDNDLVFHSDQILVDSGVKPLLFHAMKAMLNEGDEVILPTPCWTSYPGMVVLAGAKPVYVSCSREAGFKLQAADLERAITPSTKMLLLNSPSNPTGATYNAAEMRALTDVLLRHPDIWVMADDIYEHIVCGDFRFATPAQVEPKLYDRTLTLNGVSKAYSMTGWRIGYAGGPQRLIQAILQVMSQSTGCACSVSQAAAIAALNGPQAFLREWADSYEKRRNFLVAGLRNAPGLACNVPEGAFYLFPSCAELIGKVTPQGQTIASSADFVRFLLQEHGVAVVPGSAFEYDPHFRISYAVSQHVLDQACERMERACRALT